MPDMVLTKNSLEINKKKQWEPFITQKRAVKIYTHFFFVIFLHLTTFWKGLKVGRFHFKGFFFSSFQKTKAKSSIRGAFAGREIPQGEIYFYCLEFEILFRSVFHPSLVIFASPFFIIISEDVMIPYSYASPFLLCALDGCIVYPMVAPANNNIIWNKQFFFS